jgi:hypothetical protein
MPPYGRGRAPLRNRQFIDNLLGPGNNVSMFSGTGHRLGVQGDASPAVAVESRDAEVPNLQSFATPQNTGISITTEAGTARRGVALRTVDRLETFERGQEPQSISQVPTAGYYLPQQHRRDQSSARAAGRAVRVDSEIRERERQQGHGRQIGDVEEGDRPPDPAYWQQLLPPAQLPEPPTCAQIVGEIHVVFERLANVQEAIALTLKAMTYTKEGTHDLAEKVRVKFASFQGHIDIKKTLAASGVEEMQDDDQSLHRILMVAQTDAQEVEKSWANMKAKARPFVQTLAAPMSDEEDISSDESSDLNPDTVFPKKEPNSSAPSGTRVRRVNRRRPAAADAEAAAEPTPNAELGAADNSDSEKSASGGDGARGGKGAQGKRGKRKREESPSTDKGNGKKGKGKKGKGKKGIGKGIVIVGINVESDAEDTQPLRRLRRPLAQHDAGDAD